MADTTKTPFAHAPASRLVGAYLIDLLVLGALVGVTWYVHFTAWTIGMITAEAVVASALMLGASGRTPGMALMRVCLIRDEEDAQTPSLGAALGYKVIITMPETNQLRKNRQRPMPSQRWVSSSQRLMGMFMGAMG